MEKLTNEKGIQKTWLEVIGPIPADADEFKHRMRLHQGWWRAFVLGEKPGRHPVDREKQVCSTIENGGITKKNFLTENACRAFDQTLLERNEYAAGLVNEDRVVNNLLSSQPLAFNFFGELKQDTEMATLILRQWVPEVERVTEVRFEYAPAFQADVDNSAFDVAFFFDTVGGKRGLLGLECKYTDDFSKKEYCKPEYRKIFEQREGTFARSYEQYIDSRFNQLFRNQSIAEQLLGKDEFTTVVTGLFCHQDDERALRTGAEFREMMTQGDSRFKIITYRDFVTVAERLELPWEKREWVMMLWARYLALELSTSVLSASRK